MDEDQVLPRFSSEDFAQEDLQDPFLDVVLQPGDLLYMPRGGTLSLTRQDLTGIRTG